MENKTQNIVLKGLMGLLIVLGTFFTVSVLLSGDPGNMSDVELEQLAIKEAKAQNLQESKSQLELDQWLRDKAIEIKMEKEKVTFNAVSLVIDFTKYIFFFAILLVVASVGYLFTVDAKKAAINMAGILGVAGFILIIYFTAGGDVPQEYVDAETLKGVAEDKRVFTEGNWQFASAALTSTVILTSVALLGWIGGSVMKMFK
jgi:hypothetical protein